MRGIKIILDLKKFQKELRSNQTTAETRLWYYLRARRFEDFKFRRQQIIENYIVDFVCFEKNLIIELDGSQHFDQIEYDSERTRVLAERGFKVLRFWNNDVLQDAGTVLEAIFSELKK